VIRQRNEIIEQVIRLISINLGGLVNILDLEMIIMGGGVTHATPEFVTRVSQRIRDYLETAEAIRDFACSRRNLSKFGVIWFSSGFVYQRGDFK